MKQGREESQEKGRLMNGYCFGQLGLNFARDPPRLSGACFRIVSLKVEEDGVFIHRLPSLIG